MVSPGVVALLMLLFLSPLSILYTYFCWCLPFVTVTLCHYSCFVFVFGIIDVRSYRGVTRSCARNALSNKTDSNWKTSMVFVVVCRATAWEESESFAGNVGVDASILRPISFKPLSNWPREKWRIEKTTPQSTLRAILQRTWLIRLHTLLASYLGILFLCTCHSYAIAAKNSIFPPLNARAVPRM